jgi:hypothetical protein
MVTLRAKAPSLMLSAIAESFTAASSPVPAAKSYSGEL